MIDFALIAVVAGVAWCVASEGAWGAAQTLVCVVLAGLLAMNYFEPLAGFLQTNVSQEGQYYWDVAALVGLFVGGVFGLRALADYLMPGFIQVHPLAYEGVRWSCAALSGYVTMAILLTALHTAPLPREFLGFTPERQNLFGTAAPDRQWLGFTQHVSEQVLPNGRIFDGPLWKIGESTNTVWPSFPIRYADRRQAYASGGFAPTSDAQPPASGGSSRPDF